MPKALLQQDNVHLIKKRKFCLCNQRRSYCIEHIFSESNRIENNELKMYSNALMMTDLWSVIVCYFMCLFYLGEK